MSKKSKKSAVRAAEAVVANVAETAVEDAILDTIDPNFAETFEAEVPFTLEPSEPVAEEVAEVQAVEAEVSPTPAIIMPQGEIGDMAKEVTAEDSAATQAITQAQIADREAFEIAKNPDNANIHRTIKKIKGSLVRDHAARLMIAANVDPSFINRKLMDGSLYNVYAVLKFADFVDGIVGSGMSNAINIACMRSLFRFQKAGLTFTGEMAKAAASDKIRVDAAIRQHLVRHTVSASTAPTQASSTMQALQTLGVVRVTGSRKHPNYEVVEGPVTSRLRAIAEAMEPAAVAA